MPKGYDNLPWDNLLWDSLLWDNILWKTVLWDTLLWDNLLWIISVRAFLTGKLPLDNPCVAESC